MNEKVEKMTEKILEKKSAEEVYAYTPGLKIRSDTVISRSRILPVPGEILVDKGQIVDFDTVVARAMIPGRPTIVKVSDTLNIVSEDVPIFMLKEIGETVETGEIMAKYSPFPFGLFERLVKSPTSGVIESVSDSTGQVVLRELQTPVEIKAYIPGKVVEILPRRGVIIETNASYIQGIFGIGEERYGPLSIVASNPDDVLTAKKINENQKGKILAGGSLVTLEAFRKAAELGITGIIVGGIRGANISDLLGYEMGIAITGHEDISTTLIITEGFGNMSMSIRTLNLLKSFEGYNIAINGATQIRAGVIRPEIIIPHERHTSEEKEELDKGMRHGTVVRIIREPYFGKIGTVVNFPIQLNQIETESFVRVLEVKLEEENVIVPRANVEIIEE